MSSNYRQGPAPRPGSWLLAIALAAGLTACGSADDASEPAVGWRGEITTEPGITTVINDGQVWNSVELVEEAGIGALDGDDAYVFSEDLRVAQDENHLFVLDRRGGVVRIYDRDGVHLRSLGTAGDGPGEFRRPWDLGVAEGGRLLVRDLGQARIHEFSAESGELLADWPGSGGGITVFTPAGVAWLYTLTARHDDGTFDFAMIETGPDGPGRTVPLPNLLDRPFVQDSRQNLELAAVIARQLGLTFNVHTVPFAPELAWALSPDGTLATGDATDYTIERLAPDGSRLRIVRRIDPVPVHPDEAAGHRRRMTDFWREVVPDFTWGSVKIPAHKRAYASLHPDREGRLWVLRELAGEPLPGCAPRPDEIAGYRDRPCWRQPHALDAFGPDGRFLGGVELPANVRVDIPPDIRGNSVVAVTTAPDGAVRVVRYRLAVSEPTG